MDAGAVVLMVFNPLWFGPNLSGRCSKLPLSARYRMTISAFIETLIALISKFAPLRHVEWRSGIGFFRGLASDTSSLKLFSFSFASHPNMSLDPLLSDRHRYRAIATSHCTFRVHGEWWNPKIISYYFFIKCRFCANVDFNRSLL